MNTKTHSPVEPSPPHVQEMESFFDTYLGSVLRIRIYAYGYRQLSWSEVWETFADRYPGKWAIQAFPPASELLDEENIYHLFVLDGPAPPWLNIRRIHQ